MSRFFATKNIIITINFSLKGNLLFFTLFISIFLLNKFLLLFYDDLKSLCAIDFEDFDGVYADLDENNYGPINYKKASIYQNMKFKKKQ